VQIVPKKPTVKNPSEQFTGDVWLDAIASPQQVGDRMMVVKVRFLPGARTAWHSHARGQTLHVTEGVALLGSRDGTVIEALPGQTIYTPPGEEHWHGATPDDYMEHLAMIESADDPSTTTTWLEHVSDDDYRRP
jgi:quercetin dioxygenase-like cupin family protein